MAKTSAIVKNWTLVGKSSSSRDSHTDDLETVLVVPPDEIKKAREAVESVTSETATIDCHPVIIGDGEEETVRGSDASSSGLVPKSPAKLNPTAPVVRADKPLPRLGSSSEPDADPETATILVPKPKPLPTMVDDEEIEISASGIISEELEGTPTREAIVDAVDAPKIEKAEPRATITEIRELDQVDQIITKELEKGLAAAIVEESRGSANDAASGSFDDDTATEERPKIKEIPKLPRFEDETMPLPKVDLRSLGGALETVPLNAAMVQNVIAQVDARAAARASGQPLPAFQVPTGPMQVLAPPPQPTPRHATSAVAPQPPPPPPPMQMQQGSPPARSLAVEILITLLAFLAVAVPALYYLYVSYSP